MSLSLALAAALSEVPPDSRIDLHGPWVEHPGGRCTYRFTAHLSVAAGHGMPARSDWHLSARPFRGNFRIRIYPDVAGGIDTTYAHQSLNRENPDGNPWRLGKPCLNRPVGTFRRDGWSGEPVDLGERIAWYLARLLEWIDAAAGGSLIRPGDPFELPARFYEKSGVVVGFREDPAGLPAWEESGENWGFAHLSPVTGSRGAEAVSLFSNREANSWKSAGWGPAIAPPEGEPNAVWTRIPAPPIVPPWQLPSTWAELAETAAAMGSDLTAMIADAGARLRRLARIEPGRVSRLLLGFPIGETYGEPPTRMHWMCVEGLQLAGRMKFPKGSDFGLERRKHDIEAASAQRPLLFWPSANWSPDQIRSRGAAEAAVRDCSVVIIGCGALGTPVADNLVRLGVRSLALVDGDRVEAGNLCRLGLTMADIGHYKTISLGKRLAIAMPDADIRSFTRYFLTDEDELRDSLAAYDVIVDCTGSDELLSDLGAIEWPNEKIFVSLAMTWAAEGFVAFSASETCFPSVDAMSFFADVAPNAPEECTMPMEGVGCWHPVFPATADDAQFWAALATRFVREAITHPGRRRTHFHRHPDGSVERHEH